MRTATVSDVIIYAAREELARTVSDQLKIKGISNLVVSESQEACLENLKRFPKAFLILDWDVGPEDAVKILTRCRRRAAAMERPVMLLAREISDELVATAAEYSVNQIFSEEPTARNLAARLAAFLLTESMPDDVRRAVREASERRESGDSKGALQILQKALTKHPTNLRLKCDAAETLLRMNEAEKARTLLEGMERTKPPYLRGLHLLGRTHLKLGNYDEALAVLEQANLFNPHNAERLVDIGQALLNLDRVDDAERTFEEAMEKAPELKEAHLGKGQCRLMDGDVNEALSLLQDVAGNLELASVFNTCAVLNMRHGRHGEGMSLYETALARLGQDARLQARLHFNMGIGYRRIGDKQEAMRCFETSLKLDPDFKKAATQIEAIAKPARAKAADVTTPDGMVPAASESAKPGTTTLPMGDPLDGEPSEADLDSLLDEDLEESLYGEYK